MQNPPLTVALVILFYFWFLFFPRQKNVSGISSLPPAFLEESLTDSIVLVSEPEKIGGPKLDFQKVDFKFEGRGAVRVGVLVPEYNVNMAGLVLGKNLVGKTLKVAKVSGVEDYMIVFVID